MGNIPLKRVQLSEQSAVAPGKFCAMTALYPVVETDAVVDYIAVTTGLPAATIEMVLKYSNRAYEHFLGIGHPVRMGNLGIMKVTVESKAVERREDVAVTAIRPSFLPSSDLRRLISQFSTSFTDGGTVDSVGDDTADTTSASDATPSDGNTSSGGGNNGGSSNGGDSGGGTIVGETVIF